MASIIAKPCRFFAQGFCRNGNSCKFVHAPQDKDSSPVSVDTRSTRPCKFISRPGGCQNSSCQFLHVHSVEDEHVDQVVELDEDEDGDNDHILTRKFSGASIQFNRVGHVLDVSFPTDYSCACITGLATAITPDAIVDMLSSFDISITANCVCISSYPTTTAKVKVKDASFAKTLSDRLKSRGSIVQASIMPINARQTDGRKLYISWHKVTRSVWLNFGKRDVADRVAKKFNDGSYQCLGHVVKCSVPQYSGSRGKSASNKVPWTIILSNVPGNATSTNIEDSVVWRYDRPRHVEMGPLSYRASEPEVSVAVRSCLEKHGPLESFHLVPTLGGKRAKAAARFQDEADAKSALTLNDTPLGVLGKGKLTVTLVQSVKVKVPTAVYSASQSLVEEKIKDWTKRHVTFHVYTDAIRPLTTLKIGGSDAKDVATACRALDEIMRGVILVDGGKVLWGPALGSNGVTYQKLLSIAKDLGVLITREKLKQQLRFHGLGNSIEQAVRRIGAILHEESPSSYEIDLNPYQFSWAMQGGFRRIQQALNEKVAVFNVVSRKIAINGTTQQYNTALTTLGSSLCAQDRPDSASQLEAKGDCPICFCDAENPIQCSCKHTYCFECFEGYCESAASTSQEEFRIKCCGSEGTCSTIFTLQELRSHLRSSIFEQILQRSFEEYVKRRPDSFHACPTPDCGHFYRCSETRTHTCFSCFEQLCTSCHAQHGEYTCADYKDIAAGGIEALEKLKKQLNIKDCPRCKTSMEKTMGCNHMTCTGCKAHICWVCMDFFETSGPCYDHMTKVHGGIGVDLEGILF